MNLAALLHNAARSFGDRPAVSVGDELQLTYAQLQTRVARLAGGLLDAGLVPGDRVAPVMSNRPCYLEILFAIWHAGLVAVPINAKLHDLEVAYILDHCGVRLCLITDDLAHEIAGAAAGVPSVARVVCVDTAEYRQLPDEPVAAYHADRDELAWIF